MNKLTKEQKAERKEILERAEEKFNALREAIDTLNDSIDDLWADVDNALGEYNEVVDEAREWREGIVEKIDEAISNKSEKWAEGETGQAVTSWRDEFDSVDLDTLYLNEPDKVDEPDDAVSALGDVYANSDGSDN